MSFRRPWEFCERGASGFPFVTPTPGPLADQLYQNPNHLISTSPKTRSYCGHSSKTLEYFAVESLLVGCETATKTYF
jgi:hypothetical protein